MRTQSSDPYKTHVGPRVSPLWEGHHNPDLKVPARRPTQVRASTITGWQSQTVDAVDGEDPAP